MKENFWIDELDNIEPDASYNQLLSNLTKNELNEMRKLWDFHGISQLNKAELIQELIKRIADNLESWIQYLGSEQTEFLKEIIMQCERYSGAYIEVNEFTFHIAEYFQARGVVFLGQNQETAFFLIPEKLRSKIKAILNKKSIKKQIRLNDSYIKYAVGSAVYYGVLTPELLYNSLERFLTPEWRIDPLDVVVEYGEFSVLAYSAGPFFVLGAVEDASDILIERESRSDLDYYIPSKKEVENAYQKGHPSWNLAQRRFKKKLTSDYKLPDEEAEKVLFSFYLMINNNISTAEIIRILAENFGIDIFEEKDELIKLINDFHNNTKQWILKGYSPAELNRG
ncbi:MAG: SEC-C motif domain protein [Halanaerobium sp. 4-GBenrich]|uniref:Uncharacterized protein n=1 Tax=Halanaerobium congolense TaxID=54121 RepID=A0A1G6NGM1_9FIRM|nr:hypothetical protein [Halanaerobium congolense]ODS49828.1 MAG: SEC-C motif domain protein [Halanaerobium sp. 4-GBenrich]PUU89765.1 MAG: SEC-C motif domain protein [Halanaerobium sp.]PTX16446.1 hypothetical protein C7953_1164 [Halanaerobium congolense]PXV62771.1 hypothetical protein C8C78_12920 [Halanaerobium congolense]TDS32264.1 hypothetical protein BY453_10857 [Halanaerobium congolense]